MNKYFIIYHLSELFFYLHRSTESSDFLGLFKYTIISMSKQKNLYSRIENQFFVGNKQLCMGLAG